MTLLERVNPEQIKQEQERVNKLLEGVTEGQWYAYPHFGGTSIYAPRTPRPTERLEPDEHPIHVIAENAGSVDAALIAAAPDITRAYLALLDAHLALHAQLAQAERREALPDSRSAWLEALSELPPRTPADVTPAELRSLVFGVQDLRDFAAQQAAPLAPASALDQAGEG